MGVCEHHPDIQGQQDPACDNESAGKDLILGRCVAHVTAHFILQIKFSGRKGRAPLECSPPLDTEQRSLFKATKKRQKEKSSHHTSLNNPTI
jgi:hypothetical protein